MSNNEKRKEICHELHELAQNCRLDKAFFSKLLLRSWCGCLVKQASPTSGAFVRKASGDALFVKLTKTKSG